MAVYKNTRLPAQYCDIDTVCLSVWLSPYLQNYMSHLRQIFCVHVAYARGSGLLWWRCDMLSISGFLYDVMFAHNGQEQATL